MPKINIRASIESDEKSTFTTSAQLKESPKIIYYKENDTITSFNYDKKILKRENNDFYMELSFEEDKTTIGHLLVKELNQNVKVEINTSKLVIDNNNILIEYKIEENNFKYNIEVI